ncbi:hypothetical protein GWK47_027640 [Chionoecetes opilio]|uniref:Uncharacterized protein n=1 Tax=Chionoecetes opilio TaxID=41210 RepID=A0A8J8WBX5_CHIOP|nr:hypothetical protein GWK47_027640 [Chionoecetes opilio]
MYYNNQLPKGVRQLAVYISWGRFKAKRQSPSRIFTSSATFRRYDHHFTPWRETCWATDTRGKPPAPPDTRHTENLRKMYHLGNFGCWVYFLCDTAHTCILHGHGKKAVPFREHKHPFKPTRRRNICVQTFGSDGAAWYSQGYCSLSSRWPCY